MSFFNVALLQILPCGSIADNLIKGVDYCKRAKSCGADIALFPEMWSTGYTVTGDKSFAVSEDSEFITAFSDLAKKLDMAIAITFLEATDGAPLNSVCVFDRFGEKVLKYAKVHTCDFGDESILSAGDDFYVGKLKIATDTINIGAMICYDREFPESARILMLKGAEIILVPNACPMEINRISQLRGRAYENMVGIATCNYPFPHPDCNGHSNAFDGVAYAPGHSGSRDTLIVEAGENEGIYIAPFDMDSLRNYRNREVHGNAYRCPEKYGALISDEVKPPFVRQDKRTR